MGAQKNRLIETVFVSTHNICFGWEIRKISFCYALFTKIMSEKQPFWSENKTVLTYTDYLDNMKSFLITEASNEGSGNPAHSHSITRVFAARTQQERKKIGNTVHLPL